MKPNPLCKYLTKKQLKKELSAESINVYLRHVSTFMLYLYQQHTLIFPYEKYIEMHTRIESYVLK